MSTTIHLTGGVDVGNGYVKGVISNDALLEAGDPQGTAVDMIDMPSAVVSTSRPTPKVPIADSLAVETVAAGDSGADDFYNALDCSITSGLVSASDRRIFGRAALSVRGSKFTEFEVLGKHSKADQELSKVLVLGVFAAKALRDYVRQHAALPDHELVVEVRAGLALPINEFVTRRHAYAADFTAGVHLVTVKNFTTPVSIRLRFADIRVLPEGASAQFAITEKGEPLAKALLKDLKRAGASGPAASVDLSGIEAAHLVAARNTIGVDVGEGTVNFPVFTDGRFNAEASATLDEGYGTALMNAMDRLSDTGLAFTSRKQLADFLAHPPSVLQRNRHNTASTTADDEAGYLVEQIVSRFTDVLSQAGAMTEVVYVYGGGSGPIKHRLHTALLEATGHQIPVLYLDAAYSRHFNREGLYIAASHLRDAAGSAGQESAAQPAASTEAGAA